MDAEESPRSVVTLPYGTTQQEARLPDGWAIDLVAPMGPADLPDPALAMREALENPIGAIPLPAMLPEKGRMLLLVSDGTRKDGKRALLPHLLAYLAEKGMVPGKVDLMICRGTHREMTPAEVERALGPEVVRAHKILQHDCDGEVRELGKTSRGTPVAVNSRLWDYDLLLAVSGVVHHYFAGFGGGCKMFVPGAAARQTIQKSHELVFRPLPEGGGRRPGVEPGRLSGNAVHEDFVEATKMIDRPFFLLALIRGTQEGRFVGFWAGSLFKAHQSACRAYLGWKAFPFLEAYDLVLSASGGHPLDSNLIQAHKGLVGAFRLVKPGGSIIHLAICDEGLGASNLEEWIRVPSLAATEAKLRERYVIYGQTIYALKEKAAAAKITLVTSLPDDLVRMLGATPAHSLAEALEQVIPGLPPGHTTALFPEAGGLLPVQKLGSQPFRL